MASSNYKIVERKSSQFGTVGITDRGNELEKVSFFNKPMSYYDNCKRKEIYVTALDKYQHDQLARPIINMIVHAIFSDIPDFQGDDKIVKRVNEIITDSEIDWSTWGVDLEIHGDMLIRAFTGKKAKIASIPPSSIDIEYDKNNIIDIKSYLQYVDERSEADAKRINPEEMSHIKINNASNMVWGSSTLRPVFWWLDVLDNLWEKNWIRGGQYYAAPVVVIKGVPGEYQAAMRAALEGKAMRPGRNIILPQDCDADTLDFTKNYPIENLIDRIYQYILAATGIPQHLIYETDSSRGVAMFSADGFNMMIKARQRTWGLGLIRALRYILEDEGLWKDDSKLYVRWSPVFLRDLKNQASMMDVALTNRIISKQTAREMIGVDHSEEEERMDAEPDEPMVLPQVPGQAPGVQKPMASPAKAKPAVKVPPKS